MSFFQKLYELADGSDLAINIKRKNDKLTISVLPSNFTNVTPVIITGTPEDLDNGFLDAITQQLATGQQLELQVVASQQAEAAEAQRKSKEARKPKEEKKPAKKPEAPKKEEPKDERPSLF